MLYRIDREFDEYKGAGEYETKKYYQYVCGLRNVGKACLNVEDNDRIVRIVKLSFSVKGLIVCLKKLVLLCTIKQVRKFFKKA